MKKRFLAVLLCMVMLFVASVPMCGLADETLLSADYSDNEIIGNGNLIKDPDNLNHLKNTNGHGSFAEAVKSPKKLLIYGDSITHGYDTLRPSNRYVARLCAMLDAEEFNKGIGAERYFPKLSELKDPITPDYIMVAYGTNDWFCTDEETLKTNSRLFCDNLMKNYPGAKIFVISPLWRKDKDQERKFGSFERVEPCMREAFEEYKDITVVSGYDLVPKEEKYFGDLKLHPNDEGCRHYAKNLYNKIKSEI